jgi:hypothetical protein
MTAKHKSPKRKPSEIAAPVELDPFEEYGNSSPRNLTALILSEIDDGNRYLEDLVNALHALDKSAGANKAQLVKLLKSTGETRDTLMADLLERYILKRPEGHQRQPVYSMTDKNAAFESARGEVAELQAVAKLRGDRLSAADAVTRVAKERGIPRHKLDDYVNGRSRSRRKKK